MTLFEQERTRIREKVWSLVGLRSGQKVLDVGVGHIAYSLTKLIELGAAVTAIDLNHQALRQHKRPEANMVSCNAAQVPLRNKYFDIALANFTFHEIDPALHRSVCSELGRVSNRIAIVEPAISDDPTCRRFQDIWTQSMHSVKKFEDYQTIDYWVDLLSNSSKVTVTESIPSKVYLRGQDAKDYMKTVVDSMHEEGISDKYVTKIKELTEDIIEKGMIFSDVNVIIARA